MPDHKTLLSFLPASEAEAISERCTDIELRAGQVLYKVGDPYDALYFPIDTVVSITTEMDDGRLVEATMVGREGVVGLPALLGAWASHQHVLVQVAGSALELPIAAKRAVLEENPAFAARVGLLADATMAAMAQSTACMAIHPLAERCARWLLMTADRVGSSSFQLTTEGLAAMLGVFRPSVTVAAQTLQRAGLIEHRRGGIEILDRHKLESASCECYAVERDIFAELLFGE